MGSVKDLLPDIMPNQELPIQMLEEIIARLPLKSIARFRCVSKYWNYNLCSSYALFSKLFQSASEKKIEIENKAVVFNGSELFFIEYEGVSCIHKIRMIEHPFEFDEYHITQVMGSYNGFVCITQEDMGVYLWNPELDVCTLVPTFWVPDLEWGLVLGTDGTFGMGFSEIDDEIQVVNIVNSELSSEISYVQLYSSKNNKWLQLDPISYQVPKIAGRVLEGVLHWPAKKSRSLSSYEDLVIGFDIHRREFKELALPSRDSSLSISSIGVLFGSLCVLCQNESDSDCLEAWILEVYTDLKSWVRLFRTSTLPRPLCVRIVPLHLMNNGSEILLCDSNGFLIYDVKDEEKPLKMIVFENLPQGALQATTYLSL